jgi:flagellin
MSSVINTNMASLVAQRNLSTAQSALTTSVERLSSGLRINRAKDDAAGLGISETLQAQTRSVRQASRNANDAISVVQAAEGGLTEVASMLQRMKELSVQGTNDSLSSVQKGYIKDELLSLATEITKVSERTTFNGNKLLAGAAGDKLSFQVGASASSDILDVLTASNFSSGDDGLKISTKIDDVTTALAGTNAEMATAFSALSTSLDTAINTVATGRAAFGSMQSRLDHNISNLSTQSENLDAARSRIQDVDYAAETASLTRGQIMQQAATAMLSQANQMPNVILSLMK